MKFPYSEKVLEHFRNPRNVGKIEDPDGKGLEGSPACGDMVAVYIKVEPETKIIEDIKFESYGCASNIATGSVITELAKGRTLEEAKKDLDPAVYWFKHGLLEVQQKNWSDARISFLKSQKISSLEETSANLKLVERQLSIDQYESPRQLSDYAISSVSFLGTQMALTLNLFLLVIGLWSFKKTKNITKFSLILFLMMSLTGLSLWTKNWPWYVFEKEAAIYAGPSEIFEQVGNVPRAIKVLGTPKDSWVKVIYPSRLNGWVKKENLSEL